MTTNLITNAIITAYCACRLCCSDGLELTAYGTIPKANHTIAAPRSIPFGSRVVVSNHVYTVEDRTSRRFDGRFDIFFNTHTEALRFGVRTNTVTVITQ